MPGSVGPKFGMYVTIMSIYFVNNNTTYAAVNIINGGNEGLDQNKTS